MKKFPFVLILVGLFFGLVLIYNFSFKDYQQFSYLARSFNQGKFYFVESYGSWWHDAVLFNNNHYWPLGPLPAVLLMPISLIWQNLFDGKIFYQGYMQTFLVFGVFYFIYKIAKSLGNSKKDSIFWAYAFCFASSFLGVALWSNSWFFAQVITVLLLFAAIFEYLNKKRLWVIGIILGLTLLTRITASLAVAFFILEIIFNKKIKFPFKIKKLFLLIIPIFICFLILGWYNWVRFGNFFEQGYSLQITAGVFAGLKEKGIFNINYIPTNLYYFLISAPSPVLNEFHTLVSPFLKADPWGMGIVFTSPYILSLLFLSYKKRRSLFLIITSIIIAVPIFAYYGIGWYQFGFRYSLDFLPFIFLILMMGYKKRFGEMSKKMKILIIISSLFNLYLFRTIFVL